MLRPFYLALFTGVRGRVILLSWRGATEKGIMPLVQGKRRRAGDP
jgi:hypothetical protein